MPREESLRSICRKFRLGGDVRPLGCLAATVASEIIALIASEWTA